MNTTAAGDSPVFINDSEPGQLAIQKTAADGDNTDFKFKVVVTTPSNDGITGTWIYKALTGKVLSGTATVSDVDPDKSVSVTIGTDGTLKAAGTLTYEWHRVDASGNDDIVGTSATYTTSASDNGSSFYCILKDADGTYAGWVKSSEGKCEKNNTVKYAVQLLGIKADTTESGATAGLTFGPATGGNYAETEHASCGSEHCIHADSWETIAKYASEDPEVYANCLANGCTATVELNINDTIGSGTYNQAAGDGYGCLYKAIGRKYRMWNSSGNNAGCWKSSQVRAVLNGKSSDTGSYATYAVDVSQSLFSCFPDVLQSSIVAKDVSTRTTYDSDSSVSTTYDKLWLLSYGEMATKNAGSSGCPLGEGTQYARFANLGVTNISLYLYKNSNVAACSDLLSTGYSDLWWLRSADTSSSSSALGVYFTGCVNGSDAANANALAPCFCLGEYVDNTPDDWSDADVKYAVQLLDIQKDKAQDGHTIGLTFGPCTGFNAAESYKACDGKTSGCIHYDSWATIASNAKSDPHVYDDCLTNGCTKTVGIYLDGKTIGSGSYQTVNESGDGYGGLYACIGSNYRRWNSSDNNAGGWKSSQVRAVLNGKSSDTGAYATYAVDMSESLFSCFPDVLQSSIVAKAVSTRTTYNSDSSVSTTYDKLWLLSYAEMATSGFSWVPIDESSQYLRYKNVSITTLSDWWTHAATVAYVDPSSTGHVGDWWLRSVDASDSDDTLIVAYTGYVYSSNASYTGSALAPGFCLG